MNKIEDVFEERDKIIKSYLKKYQVSHLADLNEIKLYSVVIDLISELAIERTNYDKNEG